MAGDRATVSRPGHPGHARQPGCRAGAGHRARVGHDVDGGGCGSVADLRHRMEHRRLTGPHGCGRRGIGGRRIGLLGQRAGRGDVGRDRSEREGARIDRSRMAPVIYRHAPGDSCRPHGCRSHAARPARPGGGRRWRHDGGLPHHAARDQSPLSSLALADEMDRASLVGMVCRAGRCGTGAVASAVGHRVAARDGCDTPCACARPATRFDPR